MLMKRYRNKPLSEPIEFYRLYKLDPFCVATLLRYIPVVFHLIDDYEEKNDLLQCYNDLSKKYKKRGY